MQATITIDCDGAAFCDEDGNADHYAAHAELARILRRAADKAEARTDRGDCVGILLDVNGNRVGTFTITEGGDQ